MGKIDQNVALLIISEDPFDIFGKVIFWLVVLVFLNAQLLHLIHLVHVRDGA
jgi:hypothetical protein